MEYRTSNDPVQLYNTVTGYLDAGDYATAKAYAERLIAIEPDDAANLGLLASILEETGDLDSAKDMYLRAYDLDHTSVTRLRNFALFLERRREYTEAKGMYEEVLRIDPTNLLGLADYGDLLQTLEEVDEAEKVYRRCLTLDPTHDLASNNLGDILCKKSIQTGFVGPMLEGLCLLKKARSDFSNVKDPEYAMSIRTENLRRIERNLKFLDFKEVGLKCKVCGMEAIKSCGACKRVKYCRKECQKAHWPYHKGCCKEKPVKSHYGYWGCEECGGQCDCLQPRREEWLSYHKGECHHTMNTLRRKGPDCPGEGKCVWLGCCLSDQFRSFCTGDGTRTSQAFKYPEKQRAFG